MDNSDPRKICERIKNGDRASFELFYRLEYNNIIHFISSYSINKEQAEDLAQEVFCSLWEHRSRLDPDGNIHHLSELKGTAVYIDVWATWCRPCCEEIPFLEKVVAKQKNDKSIRFISVSIDEDKDGLIADVNAPRPSTANLVSTLKSMLQ